MNHKEVGQSTNCIWSGEQQPFADNAATVPITNSVTFAYDSVEQWQAVGSGQQPGHLYSRSSNPTVALFEQKLCALEGAEAATSFASGMAAISNTLLALLQPGQKVVTPLETYGGTGKFFSEHLPRYQIEVVRCPSNQPQQLLQQIAQGCDLVYLETPTNPLLQVLDIAAICQQAKKVNALVVVDNTLATPINQNPLALGADIVLHSATKYLGGHSDVLGGIACGSQRLIKQIFQYREINGACLDPHAAYLLIRSIKTLALRVRQHNDNAKALSRFLAAHGKVERVNYPGLEDHPQCQLAKQQMQGCGGVFSFTLKGDFNSVKRFLNHLQYAHLAASLGSVETLIGPPNVTSHAECTPQQRQQMGITDNLIRCAVGIEDTADLLADFEAALKLV